MSENSVKPAVAPGIHLALVAGFYIFMSAWFIAPTRTAHHTIVYLAFLLPALLHLINSSLRKDPKLKILASPVYLSLALFLIYMALTTLWSDLAKAPEHYIKRIGQTLLFVYGVYAVCRFSPRHFERAILCSVLMCTVWLLVNELHFQEAAYMQDRFRGANAGLHYLLTGALLGAILVLGTHLLLQRLARRGVDLRNALLLLCLGGVFYGVLITESRSALLALAVTAAYWFFDAPSIRNFKIIAVGIAIAAAFMLAPYAELFISRGFSQRFEIWHTTLQWIIEKPWLGHGFDAEYVLFVSSGEELYDAHNIHLEILFEGGLIGGALWLIFLATLLKCGWESRHSAMGKGLLALLIYSICVKFFESRGILSRPTEFWHLIWLCAGIALALQASASSKRCDAQNPERPSE
ncbi:O-antigen ligase family protein [Litorivivens sp.]|uniref:O-antigen ligase family protein n=1 Tax=Litorivivens sp. TaxID=2020868 RepID=UPI00356B4F5C